MEESPITWYVIIFWVLAGLAIILGIVISAEEYITEKFHENGDNHG